MLLLSWLPALFKVSCNKTSIFRRTEDDDAGTELELDGFAVLDELDEVEDCAWLSEGDQTRGCVPRSSAQLLSCLNLKTAHQNELMFKVLGDY